MQHTPVKGFESESLYITRENLMRGLSWNIISNLPFVRSFIWMGFFVIFVFSFQFAFLALVAFVAVRTFGILVFVALCSLAYVSFVPSAS